MIMLPDRTLFDEQGFRRELSRVNNEDFLISRVRKGITWMNHIMERGVSMFSSVGTIIYISA